MFYSSYPVCAPFTSCLPCLDTSVFRWQDNKKAGHRNSYIWQVNSDYIFLFFAVVGLGLSFIWLGLIQSYPELWKLRSNRVIWCLYIALLLSLPAVTNWVLLWLLSGEEYHVCLHYYYCYTTLHCVTNSPSDIGWSLLTTHLTTHFNRQPCAMLNLVKHGSLHMVSLL